MQTKFMAQVLYYILGPILSVKSDVIKTKTQQLKVQYSGRIR